MKYAENSFLFVSGLTAHRLGIEIAYHEEIVYGITIKNIADCFFSIAGTSQDDVSSKDISTNILADSSSCDKAAEHVFLQIAEYFMGKREVFTFKFSFQGTLFQQAVWAAISKIPFGCTVSYSELAVMAGKPKACRAVAKACHDNPLPLCIPCHRVIAKNGSSGGYAYGLPLKTALLNWEKRILYDYR